MEKRRRNASSLERRQERPLLGLGPMQSLRRRQRPTRSVSLRRTERQGKAPGFTPLTQTLDFLFSLRRQALRLQFALGLPSLEVQFHSHGVDVSGGPGRPLVPRQGVRRASRTATSQFYEDTNGSLLYCANSKLLEVSRIHIYRRGKLSESTFYGHGTAAFEVVTREKNPYVPILA